MNHNAAACGNFNRQTLRRLSERDIWVIGLTVIPKPDSLFPIAEGTPAYIIANKGEGQVRTFSEVCRLANELVEPGFVTGDNTFSYRGYEYSIFEKKGYWGYTCGNKSTEAVYADQVEAIGAAKSFIIQQPVISA